MTIERALLQVIGEAEDEFMAAIELARPLISATGGYLWLGLSRSIETAIHFLLSFSRGPVKEHTVGFRETMNHHEWWRLLFRFRWSNTLMRIEPATRWHRTEP